MTKVKIRNLSCDYEDFSFIQCPDSSMSTTDYGMLILELTLCT